MKIQIAIVIYHLIKEICAEFLCKKHNVLPACRGHALPEGSILPPGDGFRASAEPDAVSRGNISHGTQAALLHSWGKLV